MIDYIQKALSNKEIQIWRRDIVVFFIYRWPRKIDQESIPEFLHSGSRPLSNNFQQRIMSTPEEDKEECQERRQAEIEFVTSAYDSNEAWVDDGDDGDGDNDKRNTDSTTKIHRRLDLHCNKNGISVPIELILTLPQTYPMEVSLEVDAKVYSGESVKNEDGVTLATPRSIHYLIRPILDGALLDLSQVCQSVANENVGDESVFMVLNRAEEWTQDEWLNEFSNKISPIKAAIQQQQTQGKQTSDATMTDSTSEKRKHENGKLSLHVIRSHHLLDHAPDNMLAKGGKYKLNGLYRFGTPGLAFCFVRQQGHNGGGNDDEVRVDNFVLALEKKMPHKKFETFVLECRDEVTKTPPPPAIEIMNGWNEVKSTEDLKSILTADEFVEILKLQGK